MPYYKFALLTLISCAASFATNRALLVGVGKYPSYPAIKSLPGPENDVIKLKETLVASWGFLPANVKTMINQEASKKEIMAYLDLLVKDSRPGDFVFIYYSGHGTSFHDPKNASLGLDMRTGAILPADISPGTPKELVSRLIVGSIDLKPRFIELQKKAQVMVMFDSCYSGDSAKFIARMIPRNAELIPRGDPSLAELIQKAESAAGDWPYQNLIYISAAARHEPAWDIPQAVIDAGYRKTVDSKPHGAFTNGLLSGLTGEADLDHDGKITYQELHSFLVDRLKGQQTPQLSPRGLDNALTQQPLMARNKAPSVAAPGEEAMLRVKIEPAADALVAALRGIENLKVVTAEYDVLAEASSSGYSFTHSGGSKMFFGKLGKQESVDRLTQLATARRLVTLRFPSQTFNVSLSLENVTGGKAMEEGTYVAGDHLRLTMKTDKTAWLTLFNVDSEGNVTLIYPNSEKEAASTVAASKPVTAVESGVSSPFGTEYLKIVAFAQKPNGIEKLMGKSLSSREEIGAFEKLLQSGISQTTRIVSTMAKP